jgi:hypothetical protein
VFEIHTDHFLQFCFGWLALVVCSAAALNAVRSPYVKLLLTRAQGVLAGVLLLCGSWWLSASTTGILFATVGVVVVVSLNFFTIRICPHCAKTLYPRTELMLGFCPRCGANLSAPHERTANWRETA